MLNQTSSFPVTNAALDQKMVTKSATALRVVFSVVMLIDVLHLFIYRDLFGATAVWRFPIGPICLLWMVALTMMLSGVGIAFGTILNFLCCSIMLGFVAPNMGFQQAAGDSVAIGISMLLLFSLKWPQHTPWLLAAFLTSVYVDSGFHKLFSPMWSLGYGFATPLQLPSLVWISVTWIRAVPELVLRGIGWGVLIFELLFPAFYACKKTRLLALLAGTGMHLGIGILYPIPIFAGLMLALYAGLWVTYSRRERHQPIPRSFLIAWLALIAVAYLPDMAPAFAQVPTKLARKAVYLTTGIANHTVFADDAFAHYDYQLRIVTPQQTIPYSQRNLLSIRYSDRVWEYWWKRTQAPPVVMADASRHLISWAQNGHIEGRRQTVALLSSRPDLFAFNNAAVWHPLGEIRNGHIAWFTPPIESKLGDYVDRVLPR